MHVSGHLLPARCEFSSEYSLDFQGMSQLELEDEVQTDLKRATGEVTKDNENNRNLNRVLQLTGFSDPVYAEAYVTVHQYDIVLDVTVVNRTTDTLQNLCLELATMGDLKLVERPQNYALAPNSSKQIRANIKVSSTETGVIFGNIVYETSSVMDRNVVVLNDIHIDIMDYISPASCADVAFRNMWAEFEWENKVLLKHIRFVLENSRGEGSAHFDASFDVDTHSSSFPTYTLFQESVHDINSDRVM